MFPVGKNGNRIGTAKNLLKPDRTGQPLSIIVKYYTHDFLQHHGIGQQHQGGWVLVWEEGEWRSCAAFFKSSNPATSR